MLKLFKKKFVFKKKYREILGAPMEGKAVVSSEIQDEAFCGEMLGKGMAIRPASGKVYSPVNGTVSLVSAAKHALTIVSEGGAEILIHIGIDTVSMEGIPFMVHVNVADKVKKGDLLAEFDLNMIKAAGLDTITPIVILNSKAYKKIYCFTGRCVKPGDEIVRLVKE